ncbi:MAG TPA: 4a-hydroxytetrahydrobiopterin dehydratase [Roseiflexaceae bacterium]|nr:4a-hydroxytetrahydrobiopterin dehydratase [Roseiflexaceae bacterium]
MSLSQERCVACRADAPAVTPEEAAALQPQIPEWRVVERGGVPQLERTFRFQRYADTIAFVNRVAAAAEEQGHHPAMLVEWGRVSVRWWTHAIRNLHRNDYIMAARTDQLFEVMGDRP